MVIITVDDGGSRFAVEGAGGQGWSQAGGENSEGGGQSHRDVKVPRGIRVRIVQPIRYLI